jgi:hypothetical protein
MKYDSWKNILFKIILPVIDGFLNKTIKTNFSIQYSDFKIKNINENIVFIELFCRTILGLSGYLNNEDDEEHTNIINKVLECFDIVFNGYLVFDCDNQLLVEMANLILSFYYCPLLWNKINDKTKSNIFKIVKKAYEINPYNNNWMLFTCIIGVFLYENNKIKDIIRVYKYLNNFEKFYVGDSWYKDGDVFHMDYYNSYVILPFLCEIYKRLDNKQKYKETFTKLIRHSEFLERLISQDGTFPVFGRSAVYRTAIFHALVYSCFKSNISENLSYGQIRSSLTEVNKRVFNNLMNFNEKGFLQLGFSSYQPNIADKYSNSGSVYFCLLVFLPLGLKKNHEFWTSIDEEWSQKKLWSNKSLNKDCSIR